MEHQDWSSGCFRTGRDAPDLPPESRFGGRLLRRALQRGPSPHGRSGHRGRPSCFGIRPQASRVKRGILGKRCRRRTSRWFGLFGSWESGDPAALSLLTRSVTTRTTCCRTQAGETYRGHTGVLKAWARWMEPWEAFDTEVEWSAGRGDEWSPPSSKSAWQGQRRRPSRAYYAYRWHFEGGKVTYPQVLRGPRRSPRSRRAVGVGDVAGERRDRPSRDRRLEPPRTSKGYSP